MGLKHKLFGIVLLWPVLQGYAQEIKIGNYTFKDGAEYQGELFKGKPYGKGITHFKNGDSYEGEYVKGKRQGYGVYKFPDGEKYEGEWFQEQQIRRPVVSRLPTRTGHHVLLQRRRV